MHYYGGGWGYNTWSLPTMILTIIFWGVIILLLVKLFTHNHCEQETEATEKSPTNHNKYLDIVMERYAKGEINKKEFEQLKKDLE